VTKENCPASKLIDHDQALTKPIVYTSECELAVPVSIAKTPKKSGWVGKDLGDVHNVRL
jgi:hypothetical protein